MMERSPVTRLPEIKRDTSAQPTVSRLAREGKLEPDATAWRMGRCRILVGRSEVAGWHLSISRPDFYPGWDEIAEARYHLIPDDVTMVMILPPKGEYVALHQNTFHLHELMPGVSAPGLAR